MRLPSRADDAIGSVVPGITWSVDYNGVLERLTAWAERDENVRAVVLTGSAAAGSTHPLSDRDVEVYATNPATLLEDESWWDGLGEVLVVERLENPGWHPTRLVYYVGGKLDLSIIDADALSSTRHERPFRVLVDKDGRAPDPGQTRVVATLPDDSALREQLNWGYAAALMCAKAIVRDEPWSAKVRDRDLKASLLALIEWDHRSRYGADYDVRFLGSRMRTWMDADIQEALESCWARFDAEDSARALRASVALFAMLGERITERLGFPPFHHDRVRAEIEDILAMR